jgi:hypothetical protein
MAEGDADGGEDDECEQGDTQGGLRNGGTGGETAKLAAVVLTKPYGLASKTGPEMLPAQFFLHGPFSIFART